jgi:hypothetical protein
MLVGALRLRRRRPADRHKHQANRRTKMFHGHYPLLRNPDTGEATIGSDLNRINRAAADLNDAVPLDLPAFALKVGLLG